MLAEVTDFCWPLSIALLGLWAVQIFRLALAKRYPALTVYLLAALFTGLGGYVVDHMVASKLLGRSFYFWYYAVTQPILWLMLFAVLFECFNRMAEGYEGLRRLGRTVLYGLVGSVIVMLGLLVALDPFENPDPRFWNGVLLIQQQSVYFATAASVLALLAIRRFFSLPVPRNVAATLGAFGIYFVSIASMTAIRSYVGHASHSFDDIMDVVGLGIYCACLLFGAVAFSAKGEFVAKDRRFEAPARETLAVASGRMQDVSDQLLKAVVR